MVANDSRGGPTKIPFILHLTAGLEVSRSRDLSFGNLFDMALNGPSVRCNRPAGACIIESAQSYTIKYVDTASKTYYLSVSTRHPWLLYFHLISLCFGGTILLYYTIRGNEFKASPGLVGSQAG